MENEIYQRHIEGDLGDDFSKNMDSISPVVSSSSTPSRADSMDPSINAADCAKSPSESAAEPVDGGESVSRAGGDCPTEDSRSFSPLVEFLNEHYLPGNAECSIVLVTLLMRLLHRALVRTQMTLRSQRFVSQDFLIIFGPNSLTFGERSIPWSMK